jgi:hypothetical protein
MAKPRRRASGGGRKPQGEFDQLTSPFSLRMPEGLRKQLEAAAIKSGRSASQELLRRLNNSFIRDRHKDRGPPIRAICFLISELASSVQWRRSPQWHRNPFTFRAFKIGVAKLLDAIEPKGEIQPLPLGSYIEEVKKRVKGDPLEKEYVQSAKFLVKGWKSPQQVANRAVKSTLRDLFVPRKAVITLVENEHTSEYARSLYASSVREHERIWYGMADVRRDLGLLTKLKKVGPSGATELI